MKYVSNRSARFASSMGKKDDKFRIHCKRNLFSFSWSSLYIRKYFRFLFKIRRLGHVKYQISFYE